MTRALTVVLAVLLLLIARSARANINPINQLLVPVKLTWSPTTMYKEQFPQYRGIRNNNPGNIRHGDDWRGKSSEQPDTSFITFDSPEYGIRALARTLKTYQRKHGLNTVRGIIDRWAPPIENSTGAYIEHVALLCNVHPDQQINVVDYLEPLTRSIIRHENGIMPYSDAVIADGLAMA